MPEPNRRLDFTGRVVLVTGAGSGIGSGIARRFGEAGATVAVHYHRSEAGAREIAGKIEQRGGRALVFAADLTRRGPVEDLVGAVVRQLGGVDVLVNNAGIYPLSPLLEMPDEEWDAVVDANLRATFLCTQVVARHMRDTSRRGAIVDIASIEAHHPAPSHSHYDAAKAAVVMHARSAAQELGAHGIRVNVVSPGLIWREGLDQAWPDGVARYLAAAPLGRLGRFEDVADACLFLASPLANWITGAELVVDGGVMSRSIF
jgi:3-oxoacyl-[acyl-carrier protein] reductase